MLKQKIQEDLNSCLKEKKELEVSVLRMVLAAILNKEKDKRFKSGKAEEILLTEEEIIETISSEIKKRREAIELYTRGNRPELAEKEKKELEILQRYLPEQISEEEIKKLVAEAVSKTGAKEMKDMGRVMAELMPKVKGKADSSLVSKIVKESLS
ncbi:MAG: GatB/YqeY domain-containing protein [bacterium]|nr:GatB/YqeY domain-containing protein [bacterium]